MTENSDKVHEQPADLARDDNRLVWLDMEMTGLNPLSDRILELVIVITDAQLNPIGHSPEWVVHQSEATLAKMDAWNQKTHGESGLIERVRASTLSEEQLEREALAFVRAHIGAHKSPMCGNSIGQDRRFMAQYLPRLEAHFHYRNLDVSTLKELARRWYPQVYAGFSKTGRHTALSDVMESIEELRYYRAQLFR